MKKLFLLGILFLFLSAHTSYAASPGGPTKCSGTVIDLGIEKKTLTLRATHATGHVRSKTNENYYSYY